MSAPLQLPVGVPHRVWVEVSPTDEDNLVRWHCSCGMHGDDAPEMSAYAELAAGESHVAEAERGVSVPQLRSGQA